MPDITWQETVQINVLVEEAYRYLADLPRHAEWAQSVIKLEQVRPGDSKGVGTQYRAAERQAWQTDRLPRTPDEFAQFIDRGHALAEHMSWEAVAREYVLPGIARATKASRLKQIA